MTDTLYDQLNREFKFHQSILDGINSDEKPTLWGYAAGNVRALAVARDTLTRNATTGDWELQMGFLGEIADDYLAGKELLNAPPHVQPHMEAGYAQGVARAIEIAKGKRDVARNALHHIEVTHGD